MEKQKIGLLVMAYGTPYQVADIERYYTHIRHGKRPSDEEIEDLKEKYAAIGGISPLAQITEDQAYAISDQLNNMQADYEFKVYIGLRHIEPFIEDAVAEMAKDGIKRAVSIVLAPHFSRFSIETYNNRAKDEAKKYDELTITSVEQWYNEDGYIQFWADEIKAIYDKMPAEESEASMLIVSAHSLPEKFLEPDDPYIKQLEETARLISEKTGIKKYEIAWQSEGNTPDSWVGPDVQDITRDLYNDQKYKAFVYAPVGFVSDHLEVLYDNDYECKVVCDEVGASYYRPNMPNTNPLFIETLAHVVLRQLRSDLS